MMFAGELVGIVIELVGSARHSHPAAFAFNRLDRSATKAERFADYSEIMNPDPA